MVYGLEIVEEKRVEAKTRMYGTVASDAWRVVSGEWESRRGKHKNREEEPRLG